MDANLGNRGFCKNKEISVFKYKNTIIYLLIIKIKNIVKKVKKYFIFLCVLVDKI